jgi:hypothetical protein
MDISDLPTALPSYCVWFWSNLMSLLSPTGAQFNSLQLNSFSNFWPVFFISLGKELIVLSLPLFQANNLDHFSILNQQVIFILQNFMFFNKRWQADWYHTIPVHLCSLAT